MSSFSDAHELVEIPIIAANLHRLILPRQSQIWAVLHAADSDQRLIYLLAATFLGRMCLSGELDALSPAQRAVVSRATTLYQQVSGIIKHGRSRRFGEIGPSWRHPTGWQAIVRTSADQSEALVVAHTFAGSLSRPAVSLPGSKWRIVDQFHSARAAAAIQDINLTLPLESDYSACVLHLRQS